MEKFIDDLTAMRLIVEGAITLFESNSVKPDPETYNLVGEALYLIREHICSCFETYLKAQEKA